MRKSFISQSITSNLIPKLVILAQEQQNQAPANQQLSASELLCAISHELKTPLNAIIGFAELLKNRDITREESDDCTKEILQTAIEMSDLLNDLLDVGAINSGQLSIDLSKKINVADILKRGVKLNYNYALKRNVALKSEIFGDVAPINLDGKKLKQILTNLISNAVKYSPKGSKIEISAKVFAEEASHNFLQISITDQGFGMTKDQIHLAFQKYQTIENPNSGTVDSFGLGLPIVKQLTEMMNGTIEVKSEINKGTEIKLKFPYLM